MFRFIENIGDFFTKNYFADDFAKKVFAKIGYKEEHIAEKRKHIAPLSEKYFKYKNSLLENRRTEDRIEITYNFHSYLLDLLGYSQANQYDDIIFLNKKEIIPVRHKIYKNQKPYLYIMEMNAMIKYGETEPQGIFEQSYKTGEWRNVFKFVENGIKIKPSAINEAITELFLLKEDQRPQYVLMLAGSEIYLIHYEKWNRGSYLLFKIEELFDDAKLPQNKHYFALFYALLAHEHLANNTDNLIIALDEDSHKAAFAVTKDLKEGIINAVELLANEAVYYLNNQNKIPENLSDNFAAEIKDDCLTIVYRLLFLFYAESRQELDILPVRNQVYQKGYSLEMLRDLEQVALNSDSARNGYFFNHSLWKLFDLLHFGYNYTEQTDLTQSFTVLPLDSPLFDNTKLKHLQGVKFRNFVLKEIILQLSLTQKKAGTSRGRISYSNLGINQLGSVYEGLLAYSGFFAKEDLIEVKKADDPTGKDGTYLVPRSRRDDFAEDEIMKTADSAQRDVIIEKGKFVYRLNGRDRQKSASYYTPEVLTKTTVKYTLKHILEKVQNHEMPADELLNLKILEPAMGAAAFHNEVINQLADAYLNFKQDEMVERGEARILPNDYNTELQKVKSYIAVNNVYGVDINPTAVELGKLSLWLNVIHKDMTPPFFGHKIGVGNAVIGCWQKVYSKTEIHKNPKDKKAGTKFWEKAPKELKWNEKRKTDEIYNFLLPDAGMVPVSRNNFFRDEALKQAENHLKGQEAFATSKDRLSFLKKYSHTELINDWRTKFCTPIDGDEYKLLQAISSKIDQLFLEHYQFQKSLIDLTRDRTKIYGQEPQNPYSGQRPYKRLNDNKLNDNKLNETKLTDNKDEYTNLFTQPDYNLTYNQKEQLTQKRYSAVAPFFKLKLVMDYWASLWFWDVENALSLPTRAQYLNDIKKLIDLSDEEIEQQVSILQQNTKSDFANQEHQPSLMFPGDAKQLTFGNQIRRKEYSYTQQAIINLVVKEPAEIYQTTNNRLKIAANIAQRYRFFHYPIEFIEVFEERGGFDVIVGNPPWVKIEFDEKGVISDKYPEVEIRNNSASDVNNLIKSFLSDIEILKCYKDENLSAENTTNFLSSIQNYPLLAGQKNNLYKNLLENIFLIISTNGFAGVIHPEGAYDDSEGFLLREKIYPLLDFHFEFKNEIMLFSEVDHHKIFSVNIYKGKKDIVNFISINNLFNPTVLTPIMQTNFKFFFK